MQSSHFSDLHPPLIETHDNGIKHYNQMSQAVEAVGISLTTIVTAEIKNFRLGK